MKAADLNANIPLPAACCFSDFEPAHLDVLAAQCPERAISADELENILASAKLGLAFTLVIGDRIGAVFGLVVAWRGLAEGWMISTPAVKPIAAEFTYAMRRFCDLAARMIGLRRIQIHVVATNRVFCQWARAARFCMEARCPSYFPNGESAFLMSRIYGGAKWAAS